LAVIKNAAYNVPARGLLQDDCFGGLCKYKTLLPLIQDRLKKVVIHVSVHEKASNEGSLTVSNKVLTIVLNLNTLKKEGTGRYTGWRIEIERLLDLRSTKIQEEIHSRIDLPKISKSVGAVVGSAINVVVDWDGIIKNADFASNMEDYIAVLHTLSEKIPASYVASNFGFGQICEYEEVKKHIQANFQTLRIVPDANNRISHDKAQKTLTIFAKISGIDSHLSSSNGNFEKWGRLIESAMNLRPLRTQGAIDRASRVLEGVAKRLSEAITNRVKVAVDWNFIDHPNFSSLPDYIEMIHRICDMSDELLPAIAIVKENHTMMDIIKENVSTFTVTVDPTNKINESEFRPNEYGVDYARVYYKDEKNDNIVAAVNLKDVLINHIHGMELDLKVELLITPDRAKQRLQRAQDIERAEREQEFRERSEAAARRDRDRLLDATRDGNRTQERILREMRR